MYKKYQIEIGEFEIDKDGRTGLKYKVYTFDTREDFLWLGIVDYEDMSDYAFQCYIQRLADEMLNKPEYNHMRRDYRHGTSSKKRYASTEPENVDEPLLGEVLEPSIFFEDEEDLIERLYKEEVLNKLKEFYKDDIDAYMLVVYIFLEGMKIRDYVKFQFKDESLSEKDVVRIADKYSKKLRREKNKLRNFLKNVLF